MANRISRIAWGIAVWAAVGIGLTGTSVPLNAQVTRHHAVFGWRGHNAVSRIGATTSVGGLLGFAVALGILLDRAIEPDSAPSAQVARWSLVGGTFGGFAVGAIWDLAAQGRPRTGSISVAGSATVGGLGGLFLGSAFPFALHRDPPTALMVGSMWTGIVGGAVAGWLAGRNGSRSQRPMSDAAVNIDTGRGVSLGVALPRPASVGRLPGAHLRLVSLRF